MTEDGKMLAYVQARDYPPEKEIHLGYPWAVSDCPEGVQDKLFDELRGNPDITLHDAHQRSDGSFCIKDFIKEFNEDVHKMQRELEMLIYEKEMEEC